MASNLSANIQTSRNLGTTLAENSSSSSSSITVTALPAVRNSSTLGDGCIQIIFSQMEYIPSNNPDNIVSSEIETAFRVFKNNMLMFLLVIGGPANVINMAVFCRQGLRDRVNLCLFALSLADALHLFFSALMIGEQLFLQFTTKEVFGPVETFMINHNMMVLTAFHIISPLLSAIIATERCLCIVDPIKFQGLLRTRTMAVVVGVIYVAVIGLRFVVALRYRVGCAVDPFLNVVVETPMESEFFRANRQFLNYLENLVFGVGVPGFVILVVTTTTIITIVRLRHVMTWRSEVAASISPQEVALTKMLVGNSVFFIANMFPIAVVRFVRLFFPEMSPGRRNHNIFYTLISLCLTLTYVNATFNIVVYYLMGSRYRDTVRSLFRRRQPKKPSGQGKACQPAHKSTGKRALPAGTPIGQAAPLHCTGD